MLIPQGLALLAIEYLWQSSDSPNYASLHIIFPMYLAFKIAQPPP